MNKSTSGHLAVTSVILLFALTGWVSAKAADIAQEIRHGGNGPSASLELGFGFGYDYTPIVGISKNDANDPTGDAFFLGFTIDGRAEWRGLFAELSYESFSGGGVGYNLWSSDFAELDILFSQQLNDYDPGIGEFESLQERDGDIVAGLRSTHYFGNYIAQVELMRDISSTHNGHFASLQVGRFWQKRNWNLHATLGARYFSDKVVTHYLGVTEEESTPEIPVYSSAGATIGTMEVGATVPLNEKWLFRSTLSYHYFSDAMFKSPLVDGRESYDFFSSVNYVF